MNFKYAIQSASQKRAQPAIVGLLAPSLSLSATASESSSSAAAAALLSSNQQSKLLPSRSLNSQSNQQQQQQSGGGGPFGDQGSYLSNAIQKGDRKAPRTLIGIISSDSFNDCTYRKRHRTMFDIWNDTRVCSLDQVTSDCQVVYTFILGAGNSSAPTQLVNDSWPLLVEKPIPTKHEDVNAPDTSLLNIRENMNDGKSESFVYFASVMMKKYNLDYAMKLDADSILHLHDFLAFAHSNLPPFPYYHRVFAGALRNKYHWPRPETKEAFNQKEAYWQLEWERVHLYLAGQMYLLSLDLAEWVVQEAPNCPPKNPFDLANLPTSQRKFRGYKEGHEDHDLSSIAIKSPKPITMITIGKTQRFWEHPVKGQPRWERIVRRETARMKGEVFEGKRLRIY